MAELSGRCQLDPGFGLMRIRLIILMLSLVGHAVAQTPSGYTNPILRGGYPDPSICRVGEDYYLVNSTFEYFPGLPVQHSRDLVNWELIGYGLHREDQVTGAVNLVDVQSNGGIHAPSIRCRDGVFYIITTNVYLPPGEGAETEFVNFVITATDPAGPWSEPHVLEGAPGIDPDLFFDDDGRAWYVGTHSPDEPNFPGEGEIWLQEVDTDQWALIGERYFLWRGACGGVWAEGPHLYKRDGRYYLLVAEGGTHFNHAVTIAVSDRLTGPYESNPRNPILTSRHLSYDNWVNSTGHGDLIELPDGRWYMVLLGIRNDLERRSNMGRETHLVPVSWEREPFEWKAVKIEWPVPAPGTGRVERVNLAVFAETRQVLNDDFIDRFEGEALNPRWNFRRLPLPGSWSLQERPGHLRLHAHANVIAERGRASLVGFRQTESDFSYSARMRFDARETGSESGLSLFQKDDNFINFTVTRREDGPVLHLAIAGKDQPTAVVEVPLPEYNGAITLQASSEADAYRFGYRLDERDTLIEVAELPAGLMLSRGYTGANLGLYSTTNGRAVQSHADFEWVRYIAHPRLR